MSGVNLLRGLDLTGCHELLHSHEPWILYGRFAYHSYDVVYVGSVPERWYLVMRFKDGKLDEELVFTAVDKAQNLEDSHSIFQHCVEEIIKDTERSDVEPIEDLGRLASGAENAQIPFMVGVRESGDEDTDPDFCYDLECRFHDGQKFAAVQVSQGHQYLAFLLAAFLSNPDLVVQAEALMTNP